ncbi:CopG family ribbon-helix-helix protein [Alterisphingorhabdus coralli]|uniref:Ribbon-helix-helix protein, CopG family n=1 Tax=Alterisphingorhabdus coralli TaxID=3071408 RepID=A0AA97F5A7_9SPHN|nr:ribbon-helix-helix protein, CopG family [Parasphingorhabdus sp. SCSIO 66989]WOE74559.1 ribbon-helix-helix protein, CopG family [Parasphingorhabdus sp. SCSIO 66989]
MPSTTMTIRVPDELHERLMRLTKATQRSRSWLAADAVARYVDRELAIIEGIEQGIEDTQSGRIIDHDAAMDDLQRIVDEARQEQAIRK